MRRLRRFCLLLLVTGGALRSGSAEARPVNWTATGHVQVQDTFGNPLPGVPMHLSASARYNIRQEWDPDTGALLWTWDTEYCTANGVTDARGWGLLSCSIPWELAQQGDSIGLSIASSRYKVLERRELSRSASELSLLIVAAADGTELPLVQKFTPKLILTVGDLGVRPSPVEILDRSGDGRLGWEDVLVEVYNLAGDPLGEFKLDEILFYGGDHWYQGQYQYPYLQYVMKYFIIPGFHFEGDSVVADNPPGIYIMVPHFEWGDIGKTSPGNWYGTYDAALAAHAGDSRYTNGTTYAHVFTSGSEVVIQYWFFYPFNTSGNRHEGDWEHVNVVIDSGRVATARILRVEYYFHEKFIVARTPGTDFEVVDGTHPVVYVGGYTTDTPCSTLAGYGTHGSYPRSGRIDHINPIGSHEIVGGDGLDIDFDGYRNIVLLPSDVPRTVYAQNPELTYTVGWQHFAAGWGHPQSYPLPCDHAPFIDKALSFVDKIPGVGRPFKEVAKFVVYSVFQVGQDVYLEDTNKAPVGPRYNTRWEVTNR